MNGTIPHQEPVLMCTFSLNYEQLGYLVSLYVHKMIKIYITDDHPSIIHGLKHMLQHHQDIHIAGTFNTGKDLLNRLETDLPDVLLLDIHLPDISGNRLARIISQKYPQVAMIAFTNMNTDFHIQDMMNNGCLGYLLKTADEGTVAKGIREVYAGRKFLEQPLKAELEHDMMQTKKLLVTMPTLTKREKEVLQYICAGKTNQQIADELHLSLRTIENHRFNLQQKLKVKNTVDLIKLALHAGLIDD